MEFPAFHDVGRVAFGLKLTDPDVNRTIGSLTRLFRLSLTGAVALIVKPASGLQCFNPRVPGYMLGRVRTYYSKKDCTCIVHIGNRSNELLLFVNVLQCKIHSSYLLVLLLNYDVLVLRGYLLTVMTVVLHYCTRSSISFETEDLQFSMPALNLCGNKNHVVPP